MKETPGKPSLFSSAFGLFRSKPTKVRTQVARKASASVLAKHNRRSGHVSQPPHPYRAARIKFDDSACDAVKRTAGTRFLLRDVPLVPVPDCTSGNCTCTYVRHKDRRSNSGDRREYYSLKSDLYPLEGNEDRRHCAGRRAGERRGDAFGRYYGLGDRDI